MTLFELATQEMRNAQQAYRDDNSIQNYQKKLYCEKKVDAYLEDIVITESWQIANQRRLDDLTDEVLLERNNTGWRTLI